jgi:hypothetical protein
MLCIRTGSEQVGQILKWLTGLSLCVNQRFLLLARETFFFGTAHTGIVVWKLLSKFNFANELKIWVENVDEDISLCIVSYFLNKVLALS